MITGSGRFRRNGWMAVVASAALGVGSGASAQEADSLDLNTAYRLARERSPALRAAAAGVRAAEGGVAAARARRLPQLSADALYLRYESPPGIPIGALGAYTPVTENTWVAGLQARQPLYAGGRLDAVGRAAEASARAAELARAQAEIEVTAAVAHAHDDALLARALEDVAERSVAVLTQAVAVAGIHYQEGTASRLDVLRAETRLASARSALRRARAGRETAREALAAVIGIDPAAAPPVAGRLRIEDFPEAGLSAREVATLASAGGPAVGAMVAEADAARAGAAAARAERRPAVGLFVAGLTARPEAISGEARWGWEMVGGISLSFPFFDGGAAAGEAAAREALAERWEAEALQETLASVAAARAQRRELERARQDIVAGEETEERAARALAIAQERYTEGIGIQLEVLEAEADLSQARADRMRALHAYRFAAIELRRALGRPADARGTEPEGGSG